MSGKKIITILVAYLIVHSLFMPTYEVGKGFNKIERLVDDATITIRLTGAYHETGSRLLNLAYDEGPFFLQSAIEISGNQYDGAAFESIILIDTKSNNQILLLDTPLPMKKFHKYPDMLSIVGFSSGFNAQQKQGDINLNYNDYIIKMKIRVCKEEECRQFEFEERLKYRVKRKFYSNSFANMMGI